MQGTIDIAIENSIAQITFSHPASNSFPSHLLSQLTTTLQEVSIREDIHIIVLQSKGEGAFCAGASFDELLQVNDIASGEHFFSGFANVINAMRKCPQPIIGRIQGKTVGGGVGIAAACDYTFATQNASIKLSEIAIGIGPFVIEPAVSRKIGKTATQALSLQPTLWKDSQWALEKGLFNEVHENIPAMDEAIASYSQQLANYNPQALIEFKKVMWENTEDWEQLLYDRAKISGKLVLSDFTKNALAQFKSK